MHICLVNNLYPPINTGSSYYTKGLADQLSENGHKVIVITNQYKSKKSIEIENKVKIYRLPVIRLPKLEIWMNFPDFNFSLTYNNYNRIKKILIAEDVDIIHQCNNIFDLVFFSAHFSRKLKIPLFCSIMTQIQHTNKTYNKIFEIFDKTVIRYCFAKRVTKYVALDKESIKYVNERLRRYQNILSVPYSIPQKDIGISFQNKKIDYDKTHYRMLSLGHISNLKNRFEIIKAWKYVVNRYPQAKLVIVGGIFSKKSKKLIESLNLKNNIEMTGRIPHSEIYKYIENSDFSCMFLSENLPYNKGVGSANFEIMACGLPAILDASDNFFGDNYPFKDRTHYIKANNREPQYLSEIFLELFEKPQLRKKIGLGGQKFVRTGITWEKIINQLEQEYINAMSEDQRKMGRRNSDIG